MTVNKVPFGLRIERFESRIKIRYLTFARKPKDLAKQLGVLEQILKVNLPDFRFKINHTFSVRAINPSLKQASAFLTGEPLSVEDASQRRDALKSVSETLQSLDNVLFQIFVEPRESKDSEVRRVESEFRKAIEDSESTVTIPQSGILSGREQESKRRVNIRAARKAEQLKKKLERLRNRYLCDVRVTSISWASSKNVAKQNASQPLDILRGIIVPADETQDFSTKVKGSKKDFERLLSGLPAGKKTTLTPSEALTYFIIPDSDLGIPVAEPTEFHTNPLHLKRSEQSQQGEDILGSLEIGSILDVKDNPVRILRFLKEILTKQGGIFGDTGSGKTTTVTRILYELNKEQIPFLVFLPSKNEDYRALVRIMPKIRVFTPADETVAALRINPHISSEGVNVNKILSDTKAAYLAALPNIGMTKNYLGATFSLTYERLGWNKDTNEHGLPVLLSDFKETLPIVDTTRLLYSDTMKQDFYGALNGRLDSLMDGPLNRVFTTLTGMTIAELVSAPTIILMDGLSDEEKALLNALLLVNIAHYLESLKNKSSARKGLNYVIVMEEAHNLLTGSSEGESTEDGHAARQHAINTLLRIMREGRSSGLGVLVVDQLPDMLAPTAVKIPKTMIVHNLSSISARNLVCDQINCTESQKRQVGALAVGHAIVKLPDLAEPMRVAIAPLTKEFPQLDGLFVSDQELKAHMNSVYEKNPHFREGISASTINIGLDPRCIRRLLKFAERDFFRKAFSKAIEKPVSEKSFLLVPVIIELAKNISRNHAQVPLYCQYIVWFLHKIGLVKKGELPVSFFTKMKEQIRVQFDIDWIMNEELSHDMEQVTKEAEEYLRMTPFDKGEGQRGKNELLEVFQTALKEWERIRTKSSPPPCVIKKIEVTQIEDIPTLDPEIDTFIQTIVETDQFSKLYFERLQIATNGDIIPIVNMMVGFTKRMEISSELVQSVATRFLEYSRKTLGAPEDGELWNLIETKVGEAISA